MKAMDKCAVLRKAGYKPYARMRVMGRELELISYPFPRENDTAVGCMVREPDDPTTMEDWSVPETVVKAAVDMFGEAAKAVR